MKNPKFSIITVCYNSVSFIEDTIKSILSQNFTDFEYVIIDGGSTDGTLKVIRQYESEFINNGIKFILVSEPDNGIYDAMNKGIELANGEWINFMNSGDWFYDNKVLTNIDKFISQNKAPDIIYGDTEIRYSDEYRGFTRIQKAGKLDKLYRGMVFSHQSVFVKTELMMEFKFKSNLYNYTADFDFFLQLFISNKNFLNTNMIISSILAGGKSDEKLNRINSLKENYKISKYYLGQKYFIPRIINMIKEMTFAIFQSFTPKCIQPLFITLLKKD